MTNIEEMSKRLSEKYGTINTVSPTEPPIPPKETATRKKQNLEVSPSPSQAVGKKRGRPKGSKTRKQEVVRVGFECDLDLLNEFDKVAAKRNLHKREAFHAALKCFIQNKI